MRKNKPIPPEKWEWYGEAAHFICGRWCRFHLATRVGPWIVSTVGKLVHPKDSGGNEMTEREYLKNNPNGDQIGCDRFYETMVFPAGKPCTAKGCDCGMTLPSDYSERDFASAQTPREARENHMKLCRKWAAAPSQADRGEK